MTTTSRPDANLASALELAREAALEIAASAEVGDPVGVKAEGERLVTHFFACLKPGYVGWNWAVTLARAPRARKATVCEVSLIPGEGALLAPEWVPWKDRLRPGDLGRSDVMPPVVDDERLAVVDPATERAAIEEGAVEVPEGMEESLGRRRVLSPVGRAMTAQRWYDSDKGPTGRPKGMPECGSCGFLLPMEGSVGSVFGVCGNEWASDDGKAVSLDHGCGQHSQIKARPVEEDWPVTPARVDEAEIELVELDY
ncbi:MAG: DUF3027 domain-containing protein [Buchananella hordeovulneris]|nr:DUF3027 domain-containing protein [Buchananella hordeovulneris]